MNQLMVSIIIPTYDYQNFITEAIASIKAQSYPHWEIIIIDDGSTDQTKQVTAPYLSENIHYHYQKN